jgi:hypothetical protein
MSRAFDLHHGEVSNESGLSPHQIALSVETRVQELDDNVDQELSHSVSEYEATGIGLNVLFSIFTFTVTDRGGQQYTNNKTNTSQFFFLHFIRFFHLLFDLLLLSLDIVVIRRIIIHRRGSRLCTRSKGSDQAFIMR